MQRILVVSQKRQDIDLQKLIGDYEFSVIPRSIFNFDGKLLICSDKSKLMHAIETKAAKQNEEDETTEEVEFIQKVVIFDGMALVNKLTITKETKTCKDLKDQFMARLLRESDAFSEVRLVFDRYIEGSLKEQTREKRTSGISVRYIVKDSTSLVGLTLKRFFSHIQTKADLTIYLSEYAISELPSASKRFVVVFDTKSISNIPNYPVELKTHNQEEADTLMLLQAKM